MSSANDSVNDTEWRDLDQRIRDRLDIAAEYEAMGIEFRASGPNQGGWRECFAVRDSGNKDDKASAAVHVADGYLRGRYTDLGGDGLKCSMWDFAAHHAPRGSHVDWFAAREFYAQKVGIELPGSDRASKPRKRALAAWKVNASSPVPAPAVRPVPAAPAHDRVVKLALTEFGFKTTENHGFVTLVDRPKDRHGGKTTAAQIYVLTNRPDPRLEYLSDAARRRGWITSREMNVAHDAQLASEFPTTADSPPEDTVEHWVNFGKRLANELPADLVKLAKKTEKLLDPLADIDTVAWTANSKTLPAKGKPVSNPDAIRTATSTEIAEKIDQLLLLLGLEVLGEYDDHSVEVFATSTRKVDRIPSVTLLSRPLLVQICGDPALHHTHDGREAVENMHSMSDVREAVAYRAGKVRLDVHPPLGKGCWSVNDGIVVVNGNDALNYADGKLTSVTTPRLGSQILDFSARRPWVDGDALTRYVALAGDPAWARETSDQAAQLFRNWNWKHAGDNRVVAALVICSFVQTLWSWRPEVAIAGPSDCGKSTLFKLLEKLFCGLAMFSSKSTEAGIRQALGNSARVIMVDEFESDGNRQRILDLFRTTSQGSPSLRGTSGQQGKQFSLRHIPWVAAIETGLTRTADVNRFIAMDLLEIEPGRRGDLTLPDDDELLDLGVRLLALALRYFKHAKELFRSLKKTRINRVHGRVVENYSTPAAMWSAIHGLDEAGAVGILKQFVGGRTTDQGVIVEDDKALLAAITSSMIDVVTGSRRDRRTIAEIVTNQGYYDEGQAEAERNGISLASSKPGRRPMQLAELDYVFIVSDVVKRELLRGTRWAETHIDQILLRIKGSDRDRRRVAGGKPWGILLPKAALDLDDPCEDNVTSKSAEPQQSDPDDDYQHELETGLLS